MKRSNVICLVPSIDGDMYSINASDVENLIESDRTSGFDSIVVKREEGYELVFMQQGTIEDYFDKSIWGDKYLRR